MENIIDQEFNKYFSQLDEREKKSMLLLLKTFLMNRQQPPVRISLEQYNKEIDEALEEVTTGNFITQQEMEKRAAKW